MSAHETHRKEENIIKLHDKKNHWPKKEEEIIGKAYGCHFRQWGNRDEQEHTMSCFRVGSGSSIKEKQEIQSQ